MIANETQTDLLKLDHIAVVAPSLSEGVKYVHSKLVVTVPEGGKHPEMGTHNCLMQIGPEEYLEIIAIDPAAQPPSRPRWFGLDELTRPTPYLATWILGCKTIDTHLTKTIPEAGEVIRMSRDTLNWRITTATDGQLPMNGAFPTLIEWPDGPHPAAKMPHQNCSLVSLTIEHPQIKTISHFLADKLDDPRINLKRSNEPKLSAELKTNIGKMLLT